MKTENQKLGQEPAFPAEMEYETTFTGEFSNKEIPTTAFKSMPGMSKRFYAACAAMQGMLANPETGQQISSQFGKLTAERANRVLCITAYAIADEILKQENE